MDNSLFKEALSNNSLFGIKKVAKADLHNHADLGGKLSGLIKLANKNFKSPPDKFKSFSQFEDYIATELHDFNVSTEGSVLAKTNTILSAIDDGVTKLETSFHGGLATLNYNISLAKNLIKKTSDNTILVLPELGIKHSDDIYCLEEIVDKNLEFDFFKSIDLYGDESNFDPAKYKNIFAKAKKAGLKLKAHVGEYGPPELIVKTVELLQLDEVQHGITAAKSTSVMKWLANNRIQLNICPSSNIALQIVEDISTHPIKKLYDNGVKITVNTDDMLIFGKSLSEEFLLLYNSGLFNLQELNIIRLNAL